MKILVLGGAGSVGREVCAIASQRGWAVLALDRNRSGSSADKWEQLHRDALDPIQLEEVILDHRPDVIVNCLNLATIFSHRHPDGLEQLIRFHLNLYQNLLKLRTPLHYLQVGTTGTGGMGIDAPFSHGETLDQLPLFFKASYAGACTSMLTLLSRSFKKARVNHLVSEVKPGLAIFHDEFEKTTYDGCALVTNDGGENGHYTYNELAILTAFMEFTTARKVGEKVFSLLDSTKNAQSISGLDVVENINKAIISEDEEDRRVRESLLERMASASQGDYIIATGDLGPPSLTSDLLIAHILCRHGHVSEQEFNGLMTEDVSLRGTLKFLRQKPELLRFVSSKLNPDNLLGLSRYLGGAKEPWQVIRNKFLGRIPKPDGQRV